MPKRPQERKPSLSRTNQRSTDPDPLHERFTAQLDFDYRTRRPTGIRFSEPAVHQRSACNTLNRERARGLLEAARYAPPGESIPVDVWNAGFARKCAEWGIPLIPLSWLGIERDDDGLLSSKVLEPLTPGAEAAPYLDPDAHVVYKFFDLRPNGTLGKKFELVRADDDDRPGVPEEERYRLETQPATFFDTIRKLRILNTAGAHPTEIVGLSEGGEFLIAKQPQAFPYKDLEEDTKASIDAIRGIVPERSRLEAQVVVIWVENEALLVSDLHERNIMRDRDGHPTIIDALLGSVSHASKQRLAWLRDAVDDAQLRRKGLPVKIRGGLVAAPDEEL